MKELHSVGVPFIIIITQASQEDESFVKEIDKLNRANGITDIPIVEVFAQDITYRGDVCIPAFGLDTLVDKTLEMLPEFIRGSFIAGQQIKVVLKREQCEDIITKYEELAEKGFWDKIPLVNMIAVDQKFKKMVKEILAIYNQILSDKDIDKIIRQLSESWTQEIFSWCVDPRKFKKNKEKLEKLMADIEKNGAEGLKLAEREYKSSYRTARMITFYGYTLLMAVEDVWKIIRDEKIKNLKKVISKIQERIDFYLNEKRQTNTSHRRYPSRKV